MALQTPLGALAEPRFIIDEADDTTARFRARALGYRGISSKACKGIYKSLLNERARDGWNAGGEHYFISAEDLTCQAGLAVQQDTALVAFHGLAHAERNGHHYVDGFAERRTPRRGFPRRPSRSLQARRQRRAPFGTRRRLRHVR